MKKKQKPSNQDAEPQRARKVFLCEVFASSRLCADASQLGLFRVLERLRRRRSNKSSFTARPPARQGLFPRAHKTLASRRRLPVRAQNAGNRKHASNLH